MATLREISEQDATGNVRAIYDEVRRAYAAPYVSSLLRHLATYPGLLEWIWETLRPAFATGALQHAGWSRVDVSGLPTLPPLTRSAARRLDLTDTDLVSIGTVCRTFVRVSPVNLVFAGCVRQLVTCDRPKQDSGPVLTPQSLPETLPQCAGMVNWADLDAARREVLSTFETELAGDVFVPGLYRILAHWPAYLAYVADAFGPMLRDPDIVVECERIADRIVDVAPEILRGLRPGPNPPPLSDLEIEAVISAISTYRGTSPQMVGFGTLLLSALPEP